MLKMALWTLAFTYLLAEYNPMVLQLTGVKTTHSYEDGSTKDVDIQRDIPKECLDVGIEATLLFSGNFASDTVPLSCTKRFVTTVGKAQPMLAAPGVRSVGEVEVLDFIKNKLGALPKEYILVDARTQEWFEQMSIPSSVNIPYTHMEYDEVMPEDFFRTMKLLSFEKKGNRYDFSHAKTALLFCNGPWCSQSRLGIQKLLKIGYPKEKLLWYRGGMQDWLIFGFTTVRHSH
ncbi:MAG: rhodanese-like domain-containing protein [Sulfurospirillaceae bacterium]|nr:rhodanese-like domain-containing protein [Sulfurospirillaceae bacterium]